MSAFILNDYHLGAMVQFAVLHRVNVYHKGTWYYIQNHGTPDLLLTVLHRQNVRSVDSRYNEKNDVDDLKFKPIAWSFSAVQIIKACNCYDYQACETEDYHDTLAFAVSDAIRAAAGRKLPGYEDAGWVIEEPAAAGRSQR